jgi:hypothetical protein
LLIPALGLSDESGPGTEAVGPSGLEVGSEELARARVEALRGEVAPSTGDTPLGGTNEPSIVVDPNNASNLAYASLFELRVSNDGGATWQPPLAQAGTRAPIPAGSDNDGDGFDGEDPIENGVDNDVDGLVDEDPVDGIDNDLDGRIDEDPANPIDNDGDGLIDEDPFFQTRNGDPSLAFDSQGRLFWTYLLGASVRFDTDGNGSLDTTARVGLDVAIAGVNPTNGTVLAGYPVNVTASAGVNLPASMGFLHDKEWLAADFYPASGFTDRLHLVWTEFVGNNTRVLSSFSTDQGATWSAPFQHSTAPGGAEGFVWPSHLTVAPNGDLYVAYHSQPNFTLMAPDGISGQIFVLRSTDGGSTFPQKTTPFAGGQADMTFNRQTSGATIPNAQFWLQGSVQPWVLADPMTAGTIYVVAADDPDNNNAAGDPADVFIATSVNNGLNWAAPNRIDAGPGTSFQVMPTASIDPQSGCIVVQYYDSRNGNTNAAGNLLLDVFATASTNGGATFSPDTQINASGFDPDPGAPCRFNCTPLTDNDNDGMVDEDPVNGIDDDMDGLIDEDPVDVPTTRIGEYNGVAVNQCTANFVWAGNTVDGFGNATGQQTIFETELSLCDPDPPEVSCPADVTIECDEATDPSNTGTATATDDCDAAPALEFADVEAAGICADEKTITRTWTATDAAGNSDSCVQQIEVVDVTPPVVSCNAPATIRPPDAPISFAASAVDNCSEDPLVEVVGFDCFDLTKKGRRIDKTLSCVVQLDGNTVTIQDSGGVGDNISWNVRAEDACGNPTEVECQLEVVNPAGK